MSPSLGMAVTMLACALVCLHVVLVGWYARMHGGSTPPRAVQRHEEAAQLPRVGAMHARGRRAGEDNGTCAQPASYWATHHAPPYGWPAPYAPDDTLCGCGLLDLLERALPCVDDPMWKRLARSWIAAALNLRGPAYGAPVPDYVDSAVQNGQVLLCTCSPLSAGDLLEQAAAFVSSLDEFNQGTAEKACPACAAPFRSRDADAPGAPPPSAICSLPSVSPAPPDATSGADEARPHGVHACMRGWWARLMAAR